MKLKKKIKIVFLISSYTEYNNDLFLSLKKYFNVKVLLINLNEQLTNYKYFDKRTYLILKKKNIKNILTKLSPNIIIIGGYKIPYSDLVIKYSRAQNIKYFFWLEKINFNFLLKKFYFIMMNKYKLERANGILAVGTHAYNFYKNINSNTINFNYCINPKRFTRKKLSKNNNRINILFVGQLLKRKGIKLILDSLKLLDNKILNSIFLTFVGNGPMAKNIDKINKIFSFISLKKFQSRKELSNTYSKNNIFLFPSIYDGWGVAPMEAMASGMAIIISKNVGCAEYLTHKENGLIINSNSFEISEAIKFYFKNKNKILEYGKNNIDLLNRSNLNSNVNVLNLVKFLNKNISKNNSNYKI